MTQYRYQLERYRGRSTRHVCPQCGRKNVFTRYVDTENNNIYISDNVGKCNRLDKCGYHYTPHQYFTDNPWKREKVVALLQDIGKSNKATSNKLPPEPKRRCAGLPRRVLDVTMTENSAYLAWLGCCRHRRMSGIRAAYTAIRIYDYTFCTKYFEVKLFVVPLQSNRKQL